MMHYRKQAYTMQKTKLKVPKSEKSNRGFILGDSDSILYNVSDFFL